MKKLLFICTGNTCRSPMAQAVFNSKASKVLPEWTALSAGICSDGISAVSENALKALADAGIEFSHKSTQLTGDMAKNADIICGITRRHAETVRSMFPLFSDKIIAFPTDISDPYGGNLYIYKQCLLQITAGTDKLIDSLKSENL